MTIKRINNQQSYRYDDVDTGSQSAYEDDEQQLIMAFSLDIDNIMANESRQANVVAADCKKILKWSLYFVVRYVIL